MRLFPFLYGYIYVSSLYVHKLTRLVPAIAFIIMFKQNLFPNKYLHIATHIDTNTWKMDWKTSYLKLNYIEWFIDRFVNDLRLNVCLWLDLYPCRPNGIGNYYMCILLLNIKLLYLVTIWNRKLNFDTMFIDWILKNWLQQTSISLHCALCVVTKHVHMTTPLYNM